MRLVRFSKENYILFSIFILALIVRLAFVLQSSQAPSSDAYVYDRLGLSIAKGEGYVDSGGTPHSFYPPFYPIFLSIIYTLFGHSYLAVRIIQSIIGAFSCILIYFIGKRAHGVGAGTIAAFISIIYFPFIKSSELLLTELIFTFLLLLIVFYLLKIQQDDRFRNCIILGLLLGISLLTKSIMLLFPFFTILVFIYLKGRHPVDIFKRFIIVLLFFLLPITPWIIRNYVIFHKFIPVSAEGGLGLYSSYCPAGGIFGLNAASDDPIVIEAYRISSPVLRSRFFIKKTVDFIVNNPKKVSVLELKKLLYLWAPFDWEIVGGRWFNFLYVAMLPFFALGFSLAIIKEFRKFFPVLLPIIYFQIMTLIFYGSPRFRLPIEPYLFILAAVGILQAWRWIFIDRSVK